jgi:hypothetical protein
MQTIRVLEKTGKDGILSLRIPVGMPEADCEVVVVVKPGAASEAPEHRGWPPGYFERTFGSIKDETFVRPPQEIPAGGPSIGQPGSSPSGSGMNSTSS